MGSLAPVSGDSQTGLTAARCQQPCQEKRKIPLEIEIQCCKSFVGLTFSLTCDGEILEIWISKNLQTTSKKYVRDGKPSNVCMYEIELQIWSRVLLTSILYLEDFGHITKCRKCKCYYSYLCSLNSLTSWCSLAFDFVKLNFRERSTCWLSWGQKVGPVIISNIQNIQYEISFLDILRTDIKTINMLVVLGSKSWTTNY